MDILTINSKSDKLKAIERIINNQSKGSVMQKKSFLSEFAVKIGIVGLCFGYFACYVPYSTGTKMLTKGLFAGMESGFPGFVILPATVFASLVAMFLFITIAKWWKYADTRKQISGFSIPIPRWFTFVSGICTAGIIATTTLAYSFAGVSIVFAMLLMRGGVLVMAPIVDNRTDKTVLWPAYFAALLSLGALIITFWSKRHATALSIVCTADILLYLLSYFIRLSFMNKYNQIGKNTTNEQKVWIKRRYFVEEQMVATPLLFVGLFIAGLFGIFMAPTEIPALLWQGFADFPWNSGFLGTALVIGILSSGTGLFGTLIFLDHRSHTFCAPANRISSIFAGVIATWYLHAYYTQRAITTHEKFGVGLIVVAIVFLAIHKLVEEKKTV